MGNAKCLVWTACFSNRSANSSFRSCCEIKIPIFSWSKPVTNLLSSQIIGFFKTWGLFWIASTSWLMVMVSEVNWSAFVSRERVEIKSAVPLIDLLSRSRISALVNGCFSIFRSWTVSWWAVSHLTAFRFEGSLVW